MFGNIKHLRAQLITSAQQFVQQVAEAKYIQALLDKEIDANAKLATEAATATFHKQEQAYNELTHNVLANSTHTLEQLRKTLPICGSLYTNPIWRHAEWAIWNNADNRGLKPEDRKNVNRDYFSTILPQDNRLREHVLFGYAQPHPTAPQIPLFFSPTIHENLIITTRQPDKTLVYDFIYSLILRLLTAGRPGSVNLLMIDPVKLGEKLGTYSTAFRELPRAKSIIQGGLALTEERQIEDELVQLRTRIAEIVQTMGDNYASLEAYNQASNEIQEPYRILVIRDFPKAFSRNAVEKLLSIMSSGPKCGVYTILHIDESMTMSDASMVGRGQQLSDKELIDHYYKSKFDIAQHQIVGRGVWLQQNMDNPHTFHMTLSDAIQTSSATAVTSDLLRTLAQTPISLIEMPPSDVATNVVNTIATLHAQGDQIAIPIPPTPQALWWQANSKIALSIDVGTASRADKMLFDLSDAVVNGLIVGRIGSGKTNLLHVIIQQLCTKYSPEELVLYLIDLKQAEFHAYGHYRLPHAKVVASRTDRSFCLNVLQDVHFEVERRNSLFTQAANQHRKTVVNLAQYREVTGDILPQLVLIADEFTVLFSIDDRISAEARRIIEQIAKLGRSSGIHLLLATQALQHNTLGSSIKDQFVMRIALMCDNNTIETLFGTHNQLARTLKRRGEAIFNYTAGTEDGNRRAQVYIQHADTPKYIESLHGYATQHNRTTRIPMVFEGDIPSRVNDHPLMTHPQKMSAIRGRELKIFFGQELTLANTHISTTLSDATADNVLIMAAKSYESYVSDLLLSIITVATKQFVTELVNIHVYDGTFSADTDTWRISPHLPAIGTNVYDITETYLNEIVRLADEVYIRQQRGVSPNSIELLVMAGIPRNVNNPIQRAHINATQPQPPHQQPTIAPNTSAIHDTPFEPLSEKAKARIARLDALGSSAVTDESIRDREKAGHVESHTILDAFRQGYGATATPPPSHNDGAIDMNNAPSRTNTTFLKLLLYILEHGPAYRVHLVMWMDGINTLQNTLGTGRSVVDQFFNTRILFPMSMADASRFMESEVKAVDGFVAINQLGHWSEPRVMVYDRAQNVSTTIRPYGNFVNHDSEVVND